MVLVAHALAGAAWFGAMFYSLTVLHPKAQGYFPTAEAFEEFIATVSDGARWKVLGAMGFIGVTGIALLLLHGPAKASCLWLGLIARKVFLLLCIFAISVTRPGCSGPPESWPRPRKSQPSNADFAASPGS
jgi:hypothetical protein